MSMIFDWLSKWAAISWRFLVHLPLVQCPACKGAGGSVSGYYEPEWDNCHFCEGDWGWFDTEWDMSDFAGRIHPFRWPWVKLEQKTGHRTFHGLALCKLGYHRWHTEEWGTWCDRCDEVSAGREREEI